jgi:hypothetical protein
LTEITRRYYATAVALAKAMGLPLTEDFLRQHRESISTCFIEAGRAGIRLPAGVQLPPLTAPPPGEPAVLVNEVNPTVNTVNGQVGATLPQPVGEPGDTTPTNGHAPPPVAIPTDAGLPCAGQVIVDLKPAALSMLIGKVAALVHAEGDRWVPLLGALQAERQARLARGQRPTGARMSPAEGDGDVP